MVVQVVIRSIHQNLEMGYMVRIETGPKGQIGVGDEYHL